MSDVSSDIFGYAYADAQRNRERAIVALAGMPVKPIRMMVPMDYSLKNVTDDTVKAYQARECKTTRVKNQLRDRCVEILRQSGAQTTAEIARALRVSNRAVALALREVQNIKFEKVRERAKYGRTADGIRWSLPGMAKAGVA